MSRSGTPVPDMQANYSTPDKPTDPENTDADADAIKVAFASYAEASSGWARGRGCLMCNTAVERGPLDPGSRRYVIDETVGAINIFHHFSWLDAGLPPEHPGTPASQQFRVEGGMNRYIHEVTVCTTPACGRGR